MISTFLYHQWLQFWRSRNANRSLVLQIVLGIFYTLIFLEVAVGGILLPFLIKDKFPGQDTVALFCSYIGYYFLIGLVIRLQFQELPTLSVQPYLALPISRKSMMRFLHARSLVHVINVMPLFVFIPFSMVELAPRFGGWATACFLLSMFALVLNNHFLNQYLKRKSMNSSKWFIGILAGLLLLKLLDYFQLLSFEKTSSNIFLGLLQHPVYCLVPLALAVGSFFLNHRYLRLHLYLEDWLSEKKSAGGQSFEILHQLGDLGEIMALDLKLIFRNKRPKSLIILSGAILLYGFLFYPKYLVTGNFPMLFFFALLITGLFISNYGQFLFSWQSSHFDGLMSLNINLQQYIRAKFVLFATVCSLQVLLASLYGFMDWRIIPIQLAAYLYGIGVNSFVAIYTATFNAKYLDLGRSASMNFQGLGGMQWIQSLLISFGPALLFWGLYALGGYWVAVLGVGFLGIIGLLFHAAIIRWLVLQFGKRKYPLLEGFRER